MWEVTPQTEHARTRDYLTSRLWQIRNDRREDYLDATGMVAWEKGEEKSFTAVMDQVMVGNPETALKAVQDYEASPIR